MTNKAHDLSSYAFSPTESLLLDANVWLYLYPATSGMPYPFAAQYSAAFKGMLAAKAQLTMDALVLSEYLNRYIRIEWAARHKVVYPDLKGFRKSAAFAAVGQDAAFFARRILKFCARHDHPFASADIAQVLSDFETGANDLNDGLIAETCRMNGWKLVTNDGDFTTGGIEVLTTNPKLLAACR